jgi:flagellar hook protein FlgE
MSRSLFSSASGLLSHQRKLDVVANNLANVNTTGYKAQRIAFADLIYQTLSSGNGTSTDKRLAGTNPSQIGNGVRVASIQRNIEQGVLQITGGEFDFALEGSGFFAVSNNASTYYTRDGQFTLNAKGYLTIANSGMLVQRSGTVGEPSEGKIGYQEPGDPSIKIPIGTIVPGKETAVASFSGNIPASAKPPAAEVLMSKMAFRTGGANATSATLFNALERNTVDYVAGDSLNVTGTNPDGSSFSGSFPVTTTTTLGDFANFVDGLLTGASATFDNTTGKIVVEADNKGPAELSLSFEDAAGNTGATDFDDNGFILTTDGKDGDVVTTNVQIFDARGQTQTMIARFQKQEINSWDLTFSFTDSVGSFVDSTVTGIEFNDDGTFARVNGTAAGNSEIEIDFDSITENQKIALSFGTLSHTPNNFETFFEQDGFKTGVLKSINVGGDGVIEGLATNGVRIPIAQLAIASFVNEQALLSEGNNLYSETLNSGAAVVGKGLTGSRGQVVKGNIELSNVDIAYEFTQLIIAQRGFSANARTVTVTDQLLEELTGIVR